MRDFVPLIIFWTKKWERCKLSEKHFCLFQDNKNVSIISEQIMQHLILFACNANERCMQIIAQHRGHIDKDE